MKNLVVLGGGFGGLRIINQLIADKLPEDVSITLIDRLPFHSVKTAFYALASGTVHEQNIQVPFPDHPRLMIMQEEVLRIDLENQRVIMGDGKSIPYDDLVIGLGSEDKFQNVEGAKEYAHSIQTFEKARETYEALSSLKPKSTVSIVGAGLSGVELSSELRESRPDLRIRLFDRGKHVLPAFPSHVSTYVETWFDNHDVEIFPNSNITLVEKNVLFNHNMPLESDLIVWTGGIQPNHVVLNLNVKKDKLGRITVTQYHNIPGYENVYVVGDCASLPHSQSAQLAEGQAEQIVDVLLSRWHNKPLPENMPPIKLRGVIGSLGKKKGFGLVGDRPLTGKVPRLLKSGILWAYKYHKG